MDAFFESDGLDCPVVGLTSFGLTSADALPLFGVAGEDNGFGSGLLFGRFVVVGGGVVVSGRARFPALLVSCTPMFGDSRLGAVAVRGFRGDRFKAVVATIGGVGKDPTDAVGMPSEGMETATGGMGIEAGMLIGAGAGMEPGVGSFDGSISMHRRGGCVLFDYHPG